MQDFNPFAERKYTQKVYCGSLSRLQDPYEWVNLVILRYNLKTTVSTAYKDPVANSNYHNKPSVHLRPAKRLKSCMH